MKCHLVLVICVGINRSSFRCVFRDTAPPIGRCPVMGLLRLLPLRGGYFSHHRCDERLELLDTHHTRGGGRRRPLMLRPRTSRGRVSRRPRKLPSRRVREWRSRGLAFQNVLLVFPLVFLVFSCRSFSFRCQADWGKGDLRGTPTMTARAGPGVGNG